MNLVAAGGHVDTLVDHVVSCNELVLVRCQQQSIWCGHCHCPHVVVRPPRDAAVAPPISTDLLRCTTLADRPTFDTTMTRDGFPVRTASVGVQPQSSHCSDRLSRVRVAGRCRNLAYVARLACRAPPSSPQLLEGAWRESFLDGLIACARATVCEQLVDAQHASRTRDYRACCVAYPPAVHGRTASWPGALCPARYRAIATCLISSTIRPLCALMGASGREIAGDQYDRYTLRRRCESFVIVF